MNPSDTQALTSDVRRIAEINAKVQALKWHGKEIADAAWDKYGIKAKVVRQLAKESAWDAVQREERRQLEESLDECRAALGMLADLPLGEAAQHSVTNPLLKATNGNGAAKRSRGRPKGSRNKRKLVESVEMADDWSPPPRNETPLQKHARLIEEDWSRPPPTGNAPDLPDAA
jgi:hypothetical protein